MRKKISNILFIYTIQDVPDVPHIKHILRMENRKLNVSKIQTQYI